MSCVWRQILLNCPFSQLYGNHRNAAANIAVIFNLKETFEEHFRIIKEIAIRFHQRPKPMQELTKPELLKTPPQTAFVAMG